MSKQQWGNAVWFLFHTLAEKLRPEYSNEAPMLMGYIKMLCTTLPCPSCSNDATRLISTANTSRITDKYQLIYFLWEFHNRVNQKLRKPFFSKEEHLNKYRYANTRNIIMNFKYYMTLPSSQPKLMLSNQQKTRNVNNFLNYLQYNLYKFNP